jgi:Helix-turn-helix domain
VSDNNSYLRPITVSIKDAQAITGISRSRLYECIGRGELDAVKDGDRILVTMASLERRQTALPPAKIKPPKPRKRGRRVKSRSMPAERLRAKERGGKVEAQ